MTAIGSGWKAPAGIAVDAAGNVYVSDPTANTVSEYAAGSTTAIAVGTGLNKPSGVAVDGAGNVYIGDSGNGRVVEVPSQGGVLTNAAQAVVYTGTSGATGLAVDSTGSLLIADSGNAKVEVDQCERCAELGLSGDCGHWIHGSYYIASTITFGGTALSGPTGVAVDAAGDLFIADTGNNRIVEYTPFGAASVVSTTGVTLSAPTGVAVLPSGSLIVTDTANNVSLIAGGTATALPIGSITPNGPQGVALDLSGNVYLSDTSASKIVELAVSAPAPVSFASTAQSTTSSSNTTTVRNSGNAALTFSNAPSIDTGDLNFGVLNTGTCTSSSTVAPTSSCTVLTDFTPQATGALTGTVTLTDNQYAYTLAIALSGTATAAAGATQTITFTPPVSPVTYGASSVTLVATASSSLPVTFAVTSGPGTISGNVLTITGGGTIVVAASQAGNTSFAPASVVAYSIVVNPASQTITFPAVASPVTYGVSPITLGATSSSGLAVTYSVTSGPATISGSVLTITGGGTVVVTANQAGNTNYSAATAVSQSITVNTASQTITFPAITPVTYGVSPITLTATSSSGLAVTYSVTSGPATISGSVLTITGAGTVVVAANQVGNANYTAATAVSQSVTVKQAPQVITFTAPATPVLYPGVSPIALVATSSSGLAVTYTVTSGPATISGSTLTVTGTGSVVVAASQAGNANYLAASTISYTIVANPPPTFGIAITPGTVTAHHGSFGVVSVAVTPANGFASAVSLSCSGLPTGAICSFSPASVTPSSGPVSSSLAIYAPLTSAELHRNSNARFPGATLAIALCFFGLRKRRRLQGLVLLVMSIIGLGMMTGCGSGLSAPAATTSTVTVIATSGALQSTATVALTVQ